MNEHIQIYVRLKLKDIRDYSISKSFTGFSKFSFIFSLFLLLLFSTTIFSVAAYIPSTPILVGLILFYLIIVVLVSNLPMLFANYIICKNNFTKSKLLWNLECYNFSKNEIKTSSSNGTNTIKWTDIYKIQELKACFQIFLSPNKFFLIPRRCFSSTEELNTFCGIIISNLDKNNLKLKKYKLKYSSPDYCENIDLCKDTINTTIEKPLFTIQHSYIKKDFLIFKFKQYYKSPAGIVITLLGLLFAQKFIQYLTSKPVFLDSDSGYSYTVVLVVLLLLGIECIFIMPSYLYRSISKQFKYDKALSKPITFKFYHDFFIAENLSATNKIHWNDLLKATRTNSSLMLWISKSSAYIIPINSFSKLEYTLLTKILHERFPSFK
jgi:hypothetical protein